MKSPYQTRYQVEERGRRLVTIDTATGQAVGSGTLPQTPPSETDIEPNMKAISDQRAESALPSKTVVQITPAYFESSNQKLVKKLIVASLGLILVFLAIYTNAWVILVGAFVIPFTRPIAITLTKEGWARISKWYSDQH